MSTDTPKIRLFIDSPLQTGSEFTLGENASHYLCNVMRLGQDEKILCFNGVDGEFSCRIAELHKKHTVLLAEEQHRPFCAAPDLWLLFAPVKKDRTDFIIEKAAELGVRKILPVLTERTRSDNFRLDRYRAQAIEASEQCRRLDVPEILNPQTLTNILKSWDNNRLMYLMDESGHGCPAFQAFTAGRGHPAAMLIGPEGGFAPAEFELLYRQPFVRSLSLGPRILRAETAVAAALSLWQAAAGDWRMEGE